MKQQFDLEGLGVTVQELGPDNAEALAMLAWHELVETVETKGLPILVVGEQVLQDITAIATYLKQLSRC